MEINHGSYTSTEEGNERALATSMLDAADEKLRALCAASAGTFVSVERRGAALESSLEGVLGKLSLAQRLVSTTQLSLEQDEDNHTSLATISDKHRVRRRTLLQHSTLLELLELPSLMDACVKSHLYDEALSIAGFANTLERRHKEKNQVILSVIGQVRSRQGDLRRHLLERLKNSVTLPECLEVITALRRLNSIDIERNKETSAKLERAHNAMEMTLQLDFLEARDAWLNQAYKLDPLLGVEDEYNLHSTSGTSGQFLDVIERYRTRMFEIATQFNAIFRQTNDQTLSAELLSLWISRRVYAFLATVNKEVQVIRDSSSIRDIFDATVFFAASMGRLGADFSSLLSPVFEEKVHSLVVDIWDEGAKEFSETLRLCREAGLSSPLSSSSLVAGTLPESNFETKTSAGPKPPPRFLMTLPPMGRFVNAILTGLNELRRCLLPGIFTRLRLSLQQICDAVKDEITSNERLLMTPGLSGDASQLREKAKEMRRVFADVVIPYLYGALEYSLGNEVAAMAYYDQLGDMDCAGETKVDEEIEESTSGDAAEAPQGILEEQKLPRDDIVDASLEHNSD